MLVRKCDKCGKIIKFSNDLTYYHIQITKVYGGPGREDPTVHLDFCNDCAEVAMELCGEKDDD